MNKPPRSLDPMRVTPAMRMKAGSINGVRVLAPKRFWSIPWAEIVERTNGCGSGWSAAIIPDRMYGLCISFICNIHDFCYGEGRTPGDRLVADRIFRYNLIKYINCKSLGPVRFLRVLRARLYYNTVRKFGWKPFKNAHPR